MFFYLCYNVLSKNSEVWCINMRKISSYPFIGCDSRQIKNVSDKIGIVYRSDNDFDVYFDDSLIDDKIYKGILCYFKFLGEQRTKYINELISKDYGNRLPSVNTHLDIVIMYVNDVISFCRSNSMSPQSIDILYRLNGNPDDFRYLPCVIDLLMNDNNFDLNSSVDMSSRCLDDVVNSITGGVIHKTVNNKVFSLKKII